MLLHEMRIALRSLSRTKGLTATVIITLALGIGANAAIFSVVRGVLLRPLANRDEDRLVYIRQSSPGTSVDNINFSVPEIQDFEARVKSISAFGDFSTITTTFTGLGLEPRTITAGVVDGRFFDVMGLKPVLGRLIGPQDDGPKADHVAVLTYRFWSTALNKDRSVLNKEIQIGANQINPTTIVPRTAVVIGVLEPSVPYPTETEIIANMATSSHHMGATMNTNRTHRMTELFGRLAPGATLESAAAEISAIHTDLVHKYPEAYPASMHAAVSVTKLRDQIVAPARTILVLLLGSAAIVFLIACSNVANLILARSVRREGELAVRAALGASPAALRRTLLAESLVLCGAGALLGMVIAGPFVEVVARFASRFSVRALDVTVDATMLWVGVALAMGAAVLLAYIPRLPSSTASAGIGVASSGVRITPGTNRRLRTFATAQVGFSFVLLAAAATMLVSLVALQTAETGYRNFSNVVVFNIPALPPNSPNPLRYDDLVQKISEQPGVRGVAVSGSVPWRDRQGQPSQFRVEGYVPANGEPDPFARARNVAPGFFSVMGVPLIAGREFTAEDKRTPDDERENVMIVSQSLAQRYFPNGDAVNKHFIWTDPTILFLSAQAKVEVKPSRIIGVVADVDDENVIPGPAVTAYFPAFGLGRRLFVHADGDPAALIAPITKIIHTLSPAQPVERAATLDEVRAEVLTPERLNTFVLTGFAGVALLISVVGVAGVLAFSVSARVREFGIRLAIGSTPRELMSGILRDGTVIVLVGIVAGAVGAFLFKGVATSYVGNLKFAGVGPLAVAAVVLILAAVGASLMPALRAARVDVLQALRND